MQSLYYFLFVFMYSLTATKVDKACEYAGSNINYVIVQTEKAMSMDDINQARFFTYKALKAIEKSKKHLKACGCDYANESIAEGLNSLKLATRATTLGSTKILLNRAMESILEGIESLEDHGLHNNQYANDVLVMNTITADNLTSKPIKTDKRELELKIDSSLEKYRISLDKVVSSVDCTEAKAFAQKIYDHCEQQLLRNDLPESKFYYNLRTKEITAVALDKLKDCSE